MIDKDSIAAVGSPDRALLDGLDLARLPRHVAVIMDARDLAHQPRRHANPAPLRRRRSAQHDHHLIDTFDRAAHAFRQQPGAFFVGHHGYAAFW